MGEPDEETGEYSEFEERDVTPDDVSRIAAQNAKGVIASHRARGRAASPSTRSSRGRVGDLVTGTVLQGTPDFTIIKIRDGVEAELPHYDAKRNPGERNERPANEHYRHNQRLKVLIIEVRDPNADAPRSRAASRRARPSSSPAPTPTSSAVSSRSRCRRFTTAWWRSSPWPASRAPAPRSPCSPARRTWTRWAPASARRAAACRMVVEELRNERVDVIQWNQDPAVYVANALSPAKVSACEHRRGQQLRHRHRARRPAVAGHRQGGAERALGRAPHRLAHRHQAARASQGASLVDVDDVDDEDGGGRQAAAPSSSEDGNALPQPRPTEQPVLRRPCAMPRQSASRGRAPDGSTDDKAPAHLHRLRRRPLGRARFAASCATARAL